MIKEIALLSPVFISFFWCLVFFIQFGKKEQPKINLGIFMLFALLLYTSHAIFFSNQYLLYAAIEGIYILSMLSLYPFYYNYLLLLSQGKISWKERIIHFLPAIIFGILALIMTILLTPQERVIYVQETLINRNLKGLNFGSLVGIKGIIFFLSRVYFIIQAFFFAVKGIQLANRHNRQIEEYYSNTEGKTLNWVRFISVMIIIATASSITFAFIGRSYFSENHVALLIPSFMFSTFLFIVGLKGNQQTSGIDDTETTDVVFDFGEENPGQTEKLQIQLIELFENNKIYKNVDLRIVSVSEILKTNRTYISKLINEEFNMNFNEFVNKYRINEAEKLLSDKKGENYTLEYIAERSGFGSVSSFTRVFKKLKGRTPGNYREMLSKK